MASVTSIRPRLCRLCDAPLARHHDARSDICQLCAASLRTTDGESLALIVGGLLMVELGLHGRDAEPLRLRERLEEIGIRADSFAVLEAVRKVRRRRIGLMVEGTKWQRGYRPVKALFRWRPRARRRTPRKDRNQLCLDI